MRYQRILSVGHDLLKSVALSTALLLSVTGCSQGVKNYPSLVNQGMLPLSTTNPYSGSNLFLADEMRKSPTLYNFMSMQGAPTAIELLQNTYGSVRMLMYYPRNRETFTADLQSRDMLYEWVVRGPFAIQREDFRELTHLEAALNGEPVFYIRGQTKRFKFEQPAAPQRVLVPVIPAATPAPRPKVAHKHTVVPKVAPTEAPVAAAAGKDFKPLNSDQMALMMSRGYAERAPNGDVIHTVNAANETAGAIAHWYASDAAAKSIAELNGVPPEGPLPPGTRITIPLAQVKNFKAMPSS